MNETVLFVLMKDRKPFELPPEQRTELENRLMDYYAADAMPRFAFASTVRQHVANMANVLPALLDADFEFEIVEFVSRYRPI